MAPREKKYGSISKIQESSNNQGVYIKKETIFNRAISVDEIKL